MEAERLLDVLDQLELEMEPYDQLLAGLVSAYQAARSNPSAETQIASTRLELDTSIGRSVYWRLAPSAKRIVNSIGAESLFGPGARDRLNEIAMRSVTGLASVNTGLEEFRADLSKFRSAANQVSRGLHSLNVLPDVPHAYEIGVLIPEPMVDAKLGPLTKELARWSRDLRAIAEVGGDEEREISVRALSTGSYELFVAASWPTAVLLAKIVEKAADLYKRILEIREARKKLEQLEAPVAETSAVREHERSLTNHTIETLVREMIQGAKPPIDEGRRGELQNQLTITVTHVVRFIDKGGDVEVTPPRRTAETEEVPNPDVATADLAIAEMSKQIASLPPRREPILQLTEGEPTEPAI